LTPACERDSTAQQYANRASDDIPTHQPAALPQAGAGAALLAGTYATLMEPF